MQGTVVTVTSMKGGVGKTEVSLNTAVALKKKTAKRVIVVDFDIPYGGVSQALAVHKNVSITDWIRTNRNISYKSAESLVNQHESGIDFIPAIASVNDLEKFTPQVVNRIIDTLKGMYDYVVIDSGVDFGDITKTALLSSDKIVIVTTPSNVSVWNNHQYKEDLVALGVNPQNMLLFINQIQKNREEEKIVEKIIRTYSAVGVSLDTVSTAYYEDRIRKLRNKRDFIYLKRRNSSFSHAIDMLTERIGVFMGLEEVTNAMSNNEYSFFARIKKAIVR